MVMLNEKRLSALNDELKTGNDELQKLKAQHTEKQSAQSDIKKKIVVREANPVPEVQAEADEAKRIEGRARARNYH